VRGKREKPATQQTKRQRASRFLLASLFEPLEFSRDRFGLPPNNLLNYGYAILRAGVARALAGSGLLPTLAFTITINITRIVWGGHIMEPYRPFVDRLVHNIIHDTQDYAELTTDLKARLLSC